VRKSLDTIGAPPRPTSPAPRLSGGKTAGLVVISTEEPENCRLLGSIPTTPTKPQETKDFFCADSAISC
jgi:hypothetical protein